MTGANLVHRMYRGSKGVAVPSLNHIFNKLSIKPGGQGFIGDNKGVPREL